MKMPARILPAVMLLFAFTASDAETSTSADDGESPWLLVPSLSVDPKQGTSLGGMGGYLHRFDAESTPSMFVAGASYSDSDSLVMGVFGQMFFDADRQKLVVGAAGGWGGLPVQDVAYANAVPEKNDGKTPCTLRVKDVPVDAFWSVTAYDSTAGRLHPNGDNRYHFNNTTAVRNEDGTYTFRFKVKCEDGDGNCLEVPAGPFDVAARYYLPQPAIMNGEWTMPKPVLRKSS